MRTIKPISSIINEQLNIPLKFWYNNDGTINEREFNMNEIKSILYRYYDWSFVTDFGQTFKDGFEHNWEMFKRLNLDRYNRLYMALDLKYNPMYNYDKNSTIIVDHTGTIGRAGTTSGTDTIGAVSSSNSIPSMTSTTAEGSFDGNGALTDKLRVTDSGGTSTSTVNEHVNTTSGSTNATDTYNTQDTTTEHTIGNIGTMTAADIIEKEFVVRSKQLLTEYVHEFMCEFGYLSISSEY